MGETMNIKIFIVTYNSPHRINTCLKSLFEDTDYPLDGSVNVISNHTNHGISDSYLNRINLYENTCRPDWSTGHLSRSWNQCYLHGFKSLTNPDCDALLMVQDDTLFQDNFYKISCGLLQDYDMVQQGHGDACMLVTPELIRHVGIWDERFCQSRHAADYFWRCIMHRKEKSSFSDTIHKRIWQPIGQWELIKPESRDIAENHFFPSSTEDQTISSKLMNMKYEFDPFPWTDEKISKSPKRTMIENYIYYPYFEKDIYNLRDKGYVV